MAASAVAAPPPGWPSALVESLALSPPLSVRLSSTAWPTSANTATPAAATGGLG